MPFDPGFDAVVLAGGAARRLGGADKPAVEIGGTSMLARVVAALSDAGRVVVVGPRQSLDLQVRFCRETPTGGGPVAALAAGFGATSAGVVLVLATDLPFVAPAVARLVTAAPADGRAVLVDADGRVNHLASAWSRPALAAALDRLPGVAGAAMRDLAAGVPSVPVRDEGGWGADCDTWADVAAARAQVTRSSPA